MNQHVKHVGVFLGVVAVTAFVFGRAIYKNLSLGAASAESHERARAAVEKTPALKPDWDKALEDDMLTQVEADDILRKAGPPGG